MILNLQNLIPPWLLQVVICVTEVTGGIYSFQLGGQPNGCATHINRQTYNNIYLLQLGCYPVAVVILHVNKHEIGYY